MAKKGNLDEVREIEVALIETGRNCDRLMKRTTKHLTHLGELINDPFKYDYNVFRTENKKLENDVTAFVKFFRENCKDVFAITEHVIDSEKLCDLLKSKIE